MALLSLLSCGFMYCGFTRFPVFVCLLLFGHAAWVRLCVCWWAGAAVSDEHRVVVT